jgi:putative membrane protein
MTMAIHYTVIAVIALIGLAAGSQAGAQSFGNPGGLSPDTPRIDTGRPSPDHANTQDKLFVRVASLGGRAEVDVSKLAQRKASAEAVRSFAKRMVDEHSKSNERLVKLGQDVNAEIPKDLDAEHKAFMTELDRKSAGREFDLAYLGGQIQDHQKTATLLQYEISFGQNEALKKYAAETLPHVLEHLELAQQQHAALTSSPAQR